MVSNNVRLETYSYLNAHISFIFPFALFLLFCFIYSKKQFLHSHRHWRVIFFLLLSLIISCWMENLTCGFAATLFFANYNYYHCQHRWNKTLLACFFISILSLAWLFFSPGMRQNRTLYNNELGLAGTFFVSLNSNMSYLVFQNTFIFTVLLLAIFFLIHQTKIRQPHTKKIFYCSTTLAFILLFLPFNQSIFIFLRSGYWLVYLMNLIFPLHYLQQQKETSILLYIYATFSLLPLLFIDQTGARMITPSLFCYIGIIAIIFNQLKFKTKYRQFILLIFSLATIILIYLWLITFWQINNIDQQRHNLIDIHQKSSSNLLYLPKYDQKLLLHGASPNVGEFHYQYFLDYYHLSPDTQIIFF